MGPATEIQQRWQYAGRTPTLPLLGTGLTPLLQWNLLPPLILWLARRQIIEEVWLQGTDDVASRLGSTDREEQR